MPSFDETKLKSDLTVETVILIGFSSVVVLCLLKTRHNQFFLERLITKPRARRWVKCFGYLVWRIQRQNQCLIDWTFLNSIRVRIPFLVMVHSIPTRTTRRNEADPMSCKVLSRKQKVPILQNIYLWWDKCLWRNRW